MSNSLEKEQKEMTTQLFADEQLEDTDNITDWCLSEFQTHYGDTNITKDDIWEYLYGVMHAPDWRDKFGEHLQKNLPRIPFAPDFEAFRAAGRELMDLHIGYETCPEHPDVKCEIDGISDDGDQSDSDVYLIEKLKWQKNPETGETDYSRLEINPRCVLTNIPSEARDYTISGRSPLDWAIDTLTFGKRAKATGESDNPNLWRQWADDPFEILRHLCRLVWISTETSRIISQLPPSLPCIRIAERQHDG